MADEYVAKIDSQLANDLKAEYEDLDVQLNIDGDPCIAVEEAEELLVPAQYSVIVWIPLEIGAPVPRKRKKN